MLIGRIIVQINLLMFSKYLVYWAGSLVMILLGFIVVPTSLRSDCLRKAWQRHRLLGEVRAWLLVTGLSLPKSFKSIEKWSFIVDFPIENDDFPQLC